jgi:hypothetical protein
MPSDVQTAPASKKLLWAGWVVSALPVLMLLASGVMKLAKPTALVEEFARLGWPEHLAVALGIVEIACTVVYAIPRTSVLGAILLTGYLGGATATHVRIGDQFIPPIVGGVLVWAVPARPPPASASAAAKLAGAAPVAGRDFDG